MSGIPSGGETSSAARPVGISAKEATSAGSNAEKRKERLIGFGKGTEAKRGAWGVNTALLHKSRGFLIKTFGYMQSAGRFYKNFQKMDVLVVDRLVNTMS
jgi:hypothetical protein